MKIERILAGTDLGPDAERTLAYASFLAKGMGASLHLLFVIDFLVTPPTYLSPYVEEEKRIAQERLHSWGKRLEEYGVAAQKEVMIGRLHESFENALHRIKADMLVLGFKSHTFRRSSSEKLIKGLQIPILVVRGNQQNPLLSVL